MVAFAWPVDGRGAAAHSSAASPRGNEASEGFGRPLLPFSHWRSVVSCGEWARWVHRCWTPTLLSSCSPLTSTSCSAARRMFTLAYAETVPPLASSLSWIDVFLQPLRDVCLLLFVSRRSVHLNAIRGACLWYLPPIVKPGSAFCHHPVICEKACIGVFTAQTRLSAVPRGKSPPRLLFQVRSFEPDDSSAHAGANVFQPCCFHYQILYFPN